MMRDGQLGRLNEQTLYQDNSPSRTPFVRRPALYTLRRLNSVLQNGALFYLRQMIVNCGIKKWMRGILPSAQSAANCLKSKGSIARLSKEVVRYKDQVIHLKGNIL